MALQTRLYPTVDNGNISQAYWRTAGDNVLRKYSYRYDDMNRLREAFYQRNGQLRQSYNENMDYDKNGNIRHLNRNGALDSQNAVIEIDRLDYSYDNPLQPNQLTKVFDHSAHYLGFRDDSTDGITDDQDDYSYDDFGNLTADQNKKISSITYNHLHLPVEILFDSGSKISYLYNANGAKLRKTAALSGQVTTTDYVNGYQYRNGGLVFFPTAEGYVNNTVVNGADSFDYAYIYTDHLGNNRLTYGVDRTTGVMKIMEENHYYPYGFKHTSYNTERNEFQKQESTVVLKGPANPDPGNNDVTIYPFKYRYNGKEYQDEMGLNMYDYGARNYDPAIGRWMNIDPLAETSRRWTPYNYCYNNPVYFIDPDGMEAGGYDFKRDFNQGGISSSVIDKYFDPFNESGNTFAYEFQPMDIQASPIPIGKIDMGYGIMRNPNQVAGAVNSFGLNYSMYSMQQKGDLKGWFRKAGVNYSDIPKMTSEQVLDLISKVPELAQFYEESGNFDVRVNKDVDYDLTTGTRGSKFGTMTFGTDAFKSMLNLGRSIIHETGHALDIYSGTIYRFDSIKDKDFRRDVIEYRMYERELQYVLPEYNKSGVQYRNEFYKRIANRNYDPDSFLKR